MSKKITVKTELPIAKVKRLMELQEQMLEIAPEIKRLREELLVITQDLDIVTLKTGGYTITRAKRITPQVVDYRKLKKALTKAGIEVLTEETFAPQMDVVFKQAIEEGREFDGLEGKETEYIAVRLAKK